MLTSGGDGSERMTDEKRHSPIRKPATSSRQNQKVRHQAARKTPQASKSSTSTPINSAARSLGQRLAFWRLNDRTDYYGLLIVVGMLTGLGIFMVMSSSMTSSVAEGSGVWDTATRQILMVVLGLIAMWLALKTPPEHLRKLSGFLLVLAFVLLIAVLIPGIGTGRDEVGSQSWIEVGAIRLQPSELARVAIAVWGAHFLSGIDIKAPWKENRLTYFTVIAVLMSALIFAEGDVGMGVSFLLVVAVLLIFAGIDFKFLLVFGITGIVGLVVLALAGGFRSHRFTVYFDALLGHFSDTRDTAYQSFQGFLSLADGSLFGVGLGQSRAKWFYLPEAKNDFIFAIIGEELGFVGAAFVVVLFLSLGLLGLRTARRCSDQFMSLMAATLTAGVVVQAFINIGYVAGALPVTGIQLPMISAGGTSAIITLGAMGILINCARHEPQTIASMSTYGRPLLDRLLLLSEPKPVSQGRAKKVTVRKESSATESAGPRKGRGASFKEEPAPRAPRPRARPGEPVVHRGRIAQGRSTQPIAKKPTGTPSRPRRSANTNSTKRTKNNKRKGREF